MREECGREKLGVKETGNGRTVQGIKIWMGKSF